MLSKVQGSFVIFKISCSFIVQISQYIHYWSHGIFIWCRRNYLALKYNYNERYVKLHPLQLVLPVKPWR